MSSLLVDLFKYRSREKREAMEDWLTECVAAILRALPPHELAEALKSVTGQNCAALLEAGSVIGIATQVVIEKRIDHQMDAEKGKAAQREVQRPDMVISIDGHPWLVFENKVAHAVDHDRASDASRVSQLERYGTWLQDQQFGSPSLRDPFHTRPPGVHDDQSERTGLSRTEEVCRHLGIAVSGI